MFTGRSLCCLICMQPVNALNTGGLLSVALSVGVAGRHQRDGTGGYDVTEAQMTVIGILLLTATFGTGLWTEK
ncbi:unnamed protein product, partial [Gongylonema pulchrum]|uniref:Secreted protein n=1 Tax=Gongylonema pulchrum TaxID=637853 RepID=A0A183DKG9_9BILA